MSIDSTEDPRYHQRPLPTKDTMAALKLAAASFLSHNQNTSLPSPPPPARPHPLTISSPSPVHPTRYHNALEHVQPNMAFARGPTHTPPPHTPHTPHTPVFRSHQHYHPQQHHHHHPVSSLPSPPLSSVEPPYNGFFLKSPLQERCEALEMELASLKLRLKSPEDSSASKRKESAQGKLQDTQRELCEAKSALALHQELIRRMETTVQEQESKLKEMLAEREALAEDMKESYTMNTKQQKRLKHSTEMIENLQRENQQLIQQLHVLRSTGQGTETPDVQSETSGSVGPSRPQSYHSIFEPDHPGNKAEVERLQDLVLMMGNRHVQVQAQLTFFQQQAQQLQDQLEKTQEAQRNDLAQTTASPPQTPGTPGSSKHGSMFMENSTLSSLLTSVASVASGSPSRRTKPTRRFTVNAPRKDGELTVEQRKCEFLMDQISALQRGYDALRQEKVALELQLDLLERQQHHHQQQQLKYQSRGRAIGKEQSAALSKALAIMVASPTSATANPLSIPSTPLLPTISAAEQEREKARIQFELEQARIQAQKEAEEKEAQRLAAKAAAEEAEREAIRLKRAKSMHLKETLASLEAKRSDSRNVQITHPDELKHLEHLRHLNGEQLSRRSSSSESFHNAAPSRVSRWIGSPFSSASSFWSQPSSSSASPSPLSSSITTPSSPSAKQAVQYTHSTKHQQRSAGRLNGTFTYDVEQCSCCLGTVIDI